MEGTILDLTDNQISSLTESEAHDILDTILDIQTKILSIEGKVRGRVLELGGQKCKKCGATKGWLRFRKDGTYFCTKCGFSTGGN